MRNRCGLHGVEDSSDIDGDIDHVRQKDFSAVRQLFSVISLLLKPMQTTITRMSIYFFFFTCAENEPKSEYSFLQATTGSLHSVSSSTLLIRLCLLRTLQGTQTKNVHLKQHS